MKVEDLKILRGYLIEDARELEGEDREKTCQALKILEDYLREEDLKILEDYLREEAKEIGREDREKLYQANLRVFAFLKYRPLILDLDFLYELQEVAKVPQNKRLYLRG